MNTNTTRNNMINQQIRPANIRDERVLTKLKSTPRELFVPEDYQKLAYADWRIPLKHGQVMQSPREEGIICQALALSADDNILEIGTGSGYLTALLAQLGKFVYTIDIHADLVEQAEAKFSAMKLHNIDVAHADFQQCWQKHAPYDAICVTAASPSLFQPWFDGLANHGRLIAVVGEAPCMQVTLSLKTDEKIQTTTLYETVLPPLLNLTQPNNFLF